MNEAEAGYRRCLSEGVDALLPLSALLLQQTRYTEAIDMLMPASEAQPGNVDLAVNLSIALRGSGRAAEALKAAAQACGAAPGHPAACNARGLAELELGNAQEALAAFDEGLRRAPGSIALELHRAKALRKLGRMRDAMDVLERVVKSAPNLLEAWRDLNAVQRALGLFAPALDSATRALNLAPNDLEVALEHAVSLLHAGETRKAIRRLEKLDGDAQAWMWLGQARLRDSDVQGARKAFERAVALAPDNPFIRHFLEAASGEVPKEIEVDYIRGLFDDFADRFESTLVGRLGYATPERIIQFLQRCGVTGAKNALDLGCGTGLMGEQLASWGCRISGVDLSARMLEHARDKGIYAELHAAELLDFLRNAKTSWDLIVAADVFIYMAELQPIFEAALDHLLPNGHLVFSIECSDTAQTQLLATTGRYRHVPEQMAENLIAAGFVDVRRQALTLRMESGVPVAGELLLARRP